ncbi:hypothetical protein SUNI508_06753 [Seiridium unicorne]|uniref:Uncharacterized protein n=1 Tax=Seiridium unicorne TaxID=138068 RepID=A0ABR2UZM1_9PEZI
MSAPVLILVPTIGEKNLPEDRLLLDDSKAQTKSKHTLANASIRCKRGTLLKKGAIYGNRRSERRSMPKHASRSSLSDGVAQNCHTVFSPPSPPSFSPAILGLIRRRTRAVDCVVERFGWKYWTVEKQAHSGHRRFPKRKRTGYVSLAQPRLGVTGSTGILDPRDTCCDTAECGVKIRQVLRRSKLP